MVSRIADANTSATDYTVWDARRETHRGAAMTVVTRRAWRRDDLAGMAEVINARVTEEGEGEYATVASLAEQYDHLQNCDPDRDIVVLDDDRGRLVGYVRTFWHDVSEGYRAFYVAFEAMSSIAGLIEQLLQWGVDRARAIASEPEHRDHPDRRLEVWANDGSFRQRAVEAAGFSPFSWSAYLVRPHLEDVPELALPPGVEIRAVADDHLRAIWEADIEAFRDHHGYVEQTEVDWERFVDEASSGTELWQIAWDANGVAGQVRTYVNEGEAEHLGRRRAWTENISTRRDQRRQGIAAALIAASLRQLATLGFDEAALGVDLDNPTGALGVYTNLGFVEVLRQIHYALPIAGGR